MYTGDPSNYQFSLPPSTPSGITIPPGMTPIQAAAALANTAKEIELVRDTANANTAYDEYLKRDGENQALYAAKLSQTVSPERANPIISSILAKLQAKNAQAPVASAPYYADQFTPQQRPT